jgi:hypothetical protein
MHDILARRALSKHRGTTHDGPPATEPRQGLHHDCPHATTQRCDKMGRLGSRPRKGASSKRISPTQLRRWGSPARKKWLRWSGSSSRALRTSGTCEKESPQWPQWKQIRGLMVAHVWTNGRWTADNMQGGGDLYTRTTGGWIGQHGWRHVHAGNETTQRDGRAGVHSRSAEAQRQRAP